MVLQKTVDNLKARPRHERRAVARGIAMAVVVILLVGWVILFFNNIRANGIKIEPINIPQSSTLNSQPITDAQNQIANNFDNVKNSLQTMQNSASAPSGNVSSDAQGQTGY